MKKALLVLHDGTVFEGRSFGADTERIGEVVFNTSMTGYQEILTDPSYRGQIVTMTYTEIGNYGIVPEDVESLNGPKVEGFVVAEYQDCYSNWRATQSLGSYLTENNIPGIEWIDTRALTKHLRTHGAQMGIISTVDADPKSLQAKVKAHPGIAAFDYVKEVTTEKPYVWGDACWQWDESGVRIQNSPKVGALEAEFRRTAEEATDVHHSSRSVVVYDFGVKFNILRSLVDAGFRVTVVPAHTPAEAVLEMNPDGILLSNGPGDPQMVTYGIETAKKLMGKKPIFGICLGHQILGLAMGGRTYKLKFGHHGGNHPVKDLVNGRVEITSQNHNYCVDVESLKGQVRLTHRNLYDGSEEGMQHVELPIFSVQHHPEAGPGPNDSTHIFTRFLHMIKAFKD